MRFGLLGPLEVRAGDGPLSLGGAKQRALLALLLLSAGRVVARERLIDGLWGEAPPETAVKLVQLYVSQLRKVLPDGAIATRAPGYLLEVDLEAVDLARFDRLVAEARRSEPRVAAELLREALGLWRGPALAEFGDESFFRAESARLEELRLAAIEQRIDADLALGRHDELVGELERLVAEHPHRERLRAQLMLALYRSGRQAEALEAYRDARAGLDELGLAPSGGLRQLEQQILNQDAALELHREQALLEGPAPLPGPLVPEPTFPFVGRASELEFLRERLARAQAGEGGLVLLGGEAGGGKTRLIRELAREAVAAGAFVLYGVSDAAVTTPYQPLREWLEFLLRTCEVAALGECLGAGARELGRLVPELAPLAGEPPVERRDAESERFVLQGAVVELLLRLSRRRPLLVVADDVHWADAETLQLLRRLARNAPEARWLVVAAYRDEETSDEVANTVGDLGRLEAAARLTLGNLSDEEVGEFVRRSTEAEASVELVSALGELSDGTPLLLCELWRDLSDRGGIEVRSTVRLIRPLADFRGPSRVSELVRQRLSRFDPETVALLELAAVAGPRFELRLLAAAAHTELQTLIERIEAIHRGGMLEELAWAAASYRFSHELVRRAVYDRISGPRRAQLHLQVGQALERVAGPDAALSELAHHFTRAAPLAGPDPAVDYNLRAGRAAIGTGAYREAATQLRTALELGVADARERILVQLDLARVLRWTDGGHASWKEGMTLGSASLEAATALDERALAARALGQMAMLELNNAEADPERCRALAEAAIETLTGFGDARGLAHLWWILGLILRRDGRTTQAYAAFEQSAFIAEKGGDRAARRAASLSMANVLCLGPVPVDAAIPRCEQLLQQNCDDRESEAGVERFLSALYAMAGRVEEALELVRRSSAVLDELGNYVTTWMHRYFAADTRVLAGDRAGAEHELTTEWLWRRDLGVFEADRYTMMAAYRLALFYCDEGRWEDAELLLEYGRDVPVPSYFLEEAVLGLAGRARIAASRSQAARAVMLARRSVELAGQCDRLNFRARIWLDLAKVLEANDQAEEAKAARETAIGLYEQKGNLAAIALVRAAAGTPT